MNPSTRKLVTFAMGHDLEYQAVTLRGQMALAARHGYDIRVHGEMDTVNQFVNLSKEVELPEPHVRHPVWYKFPAILHAFANPAVELVLWLDADVVVRKEDEDPAAFLGDAWQGLAFHDINIGRHPNHGVWLLRREMCTFLRRAWDMTQFLDHFWREQQAMLHMAGYRWNAERKLVPAVYSPLRGKTAELPKKFNWCPGDPEHGIDCNFAHGAGCDERLQMLKRWAAGGSLL